MASSFLIMKPDVPKSALIVTPSATFEEDYPIAASFYGLGYNHARVTTAAGSISITFDLGTGNSRTIDHFIVGGVKSLIGDSITQAVVAGSNNGSSWTDQLGTTSGFLTRTKNGPYSDDIIFTASYNDQIAGTLAAYRYFNVTFSKASGTAKFAFRKLYFGASFDMGKEPDNYQMEVLNENNADTWKYPRGHIIMSKAYYPKHRITVEWDNVTDAKANEFMSSIVNDPYRSSVYLYTTTYLDPLYDNRLLHCRVVPEACNIKKDNAKAGKNDIVAVFEEV